MANDTAAWFGLIISGALAAIGVLFHSLERSRDERVKDLEERCDGLERDLKAERGKTRRLEDIIEAHHRQRADVAEEREAELVRLRDKLAQIEGRMRAGHHDPTGEQPYARTVPPAARKRRGGDRHPPRS